MGFTYLEKFSYLNTFMLGLAQRCSDNGGLTVSNLTDSQILENVNPALAEDQKNLLFMVISKPLAEILTVNNVLHCKCSAQFYCLHNC